jgi:hypothetical protein
MMRLRLAVALLLLSTPAFAAPIMQVKGLKADEGCLAPSVAATEKLKTCPVANERVRIWCPNGNVFDRDPGGAGVAVLRAICEMNQLPG